MVRLDQFRKQKCVTRCSGAPGPSGARQRGLPRSNGSKRASPLWCMEARVLAGAVSRRMGAPASEITYLCALSLLACSLILVHLDASLRVEGNSLLVWSCRGSGDGLCPSRVVSVVRAVFSSPILWSPCVCLQLPEEAALLGTNVPCRTVEKR